MRFFLLIIFCCSDLIAAAQGNLKIFVTKENGKTVFYAQNNEFCPVSVEINLTLGNLQATEFGNGIFVVPAYSQKYQLFELEKINQGKTTYSYTYKAVFGDVNKTDYDRMHLYDLPFKKGSRFRIEQGYNGVFTHQNEKALDFNLPQGTPVRAARAGVVIAVEQKFTETCLREECKKMANYVLIYHSDGTIADYSHLQHNGSLVAVGDSVIAGELIALSGSTGFARGPHLHFVCFLPGFEKRRTVKTRFRINNGKTAVYLAEDKTYWKNYQ